MFPGFRQVRVQFEVGWFMVLNATPLELSSRQKGWRRNTSYKVTLTYNGKFIKLQVHILHSTANFYVGVLCRFTTSVSNVIVFLLFQYREQFTAWKMSTFVMWNVWMLCNNSSYRGEAFDMHYNMIRGHVGLVFLGSAYFLKHRMYFVYVIIIPGKLKQV